MRHDGRERRRRLVAPDRIDQVALDRFETAAGLGGSGGIALDLARDVEPGIVAEDLPRREMGGDPFMGGLLGQMAVFIERAVDLGAHLQGVAAIDEDRRAVGQDHGEAGRAGEAGEPGEALRPERHVLALVLVGARNDEAAEPAALQLGAERRKAGGGIRLRRRGPAAALGKLVAEGVELRREGRRDFGRDEAGPVGSGRRGEDALDQRLEAGEVIGRACFGKKPGERRVSLISRPTHRRLAIHARHLVRFSGKARPGTARRQ